MKKNKKFPGDEDQGECRELAEALMKANGPDSHQVEIEEDVFNKAVAYCDRSISPMAAFFGGIVA